MDHDDWMEVEPLSVVIDGTNRMIAAPKLFKTGSRGWYVSGKTTIGDEKVQVSCCITVVGSKPAPKAPPAVPIPSQVNGKAPSKPQKPRKAGNAVQTTLDDVKPAELG